MLYIDLYLLLGFVGGRGGSKVEGERHVVGGGLGEGGIYKLIRNFGVGLRC